MTISRILLVSILSLFFFSCSEDYVTEGNAQDADLRINNYLGNYENIHPKVLYFESGWNGYEFWMAYTPYPMGETEAENPSLAVSHDGIEWYEAPGVVNPVEYKPQNGYNSDTHLLYDEENNNLEIWWRPFIKKKGDAVCRKVSKDGIHWSDTQTVVEIGEFDSMILSPAVLKEDNKYMMFFSNGSRIRRAIGFFKEGKFIWNHPEDVDIEWGDLSAWHLDIIKNESGLLEMVVCAYGPGEDNNSADLYYLTYNPETEEATSPEMILKRGENKKDISYRSIYRSSILKVGTLYYLYYSCIDNKWHRHMSLMIGNSPSILRSFTDIH